MREALRRRRRARRRRPRGPPGEVLALVGDNGAGKSTLVKSIAGALAPDAGSYAFEGRDVRIASPHVAAQLGIATVYQDLAICDNLDVVANLFLGRERVRRPRRVGCGRPREPGMEARTRIGAGLALGQSCATCAAGLRSVRRPAPGGRGRPRRAVGLQARAARRADGGARRRTDRMVLRTGERPARPRPGRDRDLAQPVRRVPGRGPHRGPAARAQRGDIRARETTPDAVVAAITGGRTLGAGRRG